MNRGVQLLQRTAKKSLTTNPQPLIHFLSTKPYINEEVPIHGREPQAGKETKNAKQGIFIETKPSEKHFSLDPKYPEPRLVKVATRHEMTGANRIVMKPVEEPPVHRRHHEFTGRYF